ncbi:MAG: MFS transporter [Geminicoccaceae bacterium]
MTLTSPPDASLPAMSRRRDVKVMTLVGVGHFLSHFYLMTLPPLFPVLKEAFAVSYLQLGLALGILNLTTALTQAPVGFLVDRLGPRTILITGLSVFAFAIALVGIAPSYPALILFMVLAGLGNSVFHPADYSILSTIDHQRMGRAYSIHTFGGFAGFAAAPPIAVGLTALIGWQGALLIMGTAGIAVAFVMLINSAVLTGDISGPDRQSEQDPRSTLDTQSASDKANDMKGGIQLLLSPSMLIGLLLFLMLAVSHGGITAFSVAAIKDLYDLPLAAANVPLTSYLTASALGVLAGGWIADRVVNQDRIVAVYLVLTALSVAPIAAISLSVWTIAILTGVAGFLSGAIAPSRDLMIRSMTPPGSSGKVFGFVTSGFNIGGIVTPFIFGAAMDSGDPRLVFWLVVAFNLLTLIVVFATGREVHQNANRASDKAAD